MTPPAIEQVLSSLTDSRESHLGALWRAMRMLATEGYAPLVRRCCAVWARHAVLCSFDGPAPNGAILRRSCRVAYRYAADRATDREIYVARCQAESMARESTGASFHAAAAVSRACAFPGMPDSAEKPPPGWFEAAAWDVPWCAARASRAPHAAWAAYRRHLLRALRRLVREESVGA